APARQVRTVSAGSRPGPSGCCGPRCRDRGVAAPRVMSRNARPHPRSSSPPMSGLVVCGGESARMGFEKALIEVGGEPLVLRVARRLARVADPVLLATGSPGRLEPPGYPDCADEGPG